MDRLGRDWCGKRMDRLETWRMGIMAMNAEQVAFFSVPEAGPLAVDAHLPVTKRGAMALAAEPVGFRELDEPSVREVQEIAILRIVTVQAPAVPLVVVQIDPFVLEGQFAAFPVHIVFRVMTIAAWENILAEGRRRNLDLILGPGSLVRLGRAHPGADSRRIIMTIVPGAQSRVSHKISSQGHPRQKSRDPEPENESVYHQYTSVEIQRSLDNARQQAHARIQNGMGRNSQSSGFIKSTGKTAKSTPHPWKVRSY